ncbi:lipoprotein [Streptomyces sp. NPDC017993]|uniref:lipoprotein n=1 Tax=Streptomyces sp. NPDC017993 TaxID=3365027 RepID=UPI003797689C
MTKARGDQTVGGCRRRWKSPLPNRITTTWSAIHSSTTAMAALIHGLDRTPGLLTPLRPQQVEPRLRPEDQVDGCDSICRISCGDFSNLRAQWWGISGMPKVSEAIVGAVVALSMLSGCSFSWGGDEKKKVAEKKLGDKGTACELPVHFKLATSWKAEAITQATVDQMGPLGHQGPLTPACELDANPAGHMGFLIVWSGTKGAAAPGSKTHALMKKFVTAESFESNIKFREIKAHGLPATEASYNVTDLSAGEIRTERALAVMTKHGGVVIHLGGLNADEHKAMLPAFELAKRTLGLTPE